MKGGETRSVPRLHVFDFWMYCQKFKIKMSTSSIHNGLFNVLILWERSYTSPLPHSFNCSEKKAIFMKPGDAVASHKSFHKCWNMCPKQRHYLWLNSQKRSLKWCEYFDLKRNRNSWHISSLLPVVNESDKFLKPSVWRFATSAWNPEDLKTSPEFLI